MFYGFSVGGGHLAAQCKSIYFKAWPHVIISSLSCLRRTKKKKKKIPTAKPPSAPLPTHGSTSRRSHGERRDWLARGGRQGLGGLECLRGGTAAGLQRVNRTLGDGGMEEDGSRDENVESAASPPSPGKRKASKACRFRAHTNCGPPWVSAHRIRLWPDGRGAQITSELIVLKAKTAVSTRSQLTRLNQFMRRTFFFLLKLNDLRYLATEKKHLCFATVLKYNKVCPHTYL